METENKRKKLFAQIIKFAFVGGTSFVIDFVITMILSFIFREFGASTETAATVASIFGFVISLIYNYFMSMHFVFERRDDMDRRVEFLIFTVLSLIGLGLNALIMYYGVVLTKLWLPEYEANNPGIVTAGVKMVATGIVMVYNFISRKLTLEKKHEA